MRQPNPRNRIGILRGVLVLCLFRASLATGFSSGENKVTANTAHSGILLLPHRVKLKAILYPFIADITTPLNTDTYAPIPPKNLKAPSSPLFINADATIIKIFHLLRNRKQDVKARFESAFTLLYFEWDGGKQRVFVDQRGVLMDGRSRVLGVLPVSSLRHLYAILSDLTTKQLAAEAAAREQHDRIW